MADGISHQVPAQSLILTDVVLQRALVQFGAGQAEWVGLSGRTLGDPLWRSLSEGDFVRLARAMHQREAQ